MTAKTTSIQLDRSPAAVARREAEVDRRLSASTATGAARNAERRRVLSEIEAEDTAEAEAAADRAEAAAERLRISSIVRLGRDQNRGQQALRAALLAPIGADAARGLLATMPSDAAAGPAALAVPAFTGFGGPAAQSERRRITGAFSRPEASGGSPQSPRWSLSATRR